MKKTLIIGIILIAFFFLVREKYSGPNVSQNGIAPSQLASEIELKYDVNSDGLLDVTQESFKRTIKDNLIHVESRGLLFTDADAFGNKDGSVTNYELLNYLQEFDTDRDGELTTYKNIIKSLFGDKSEWAMFIEKYEEKFKYEEVDKSKNISNQ
jgi:hypothetical protein